MAYEKYFAKAGEYDIPADLPKVPQEVRPVLWMDGKRIEGCTYTMGLCWLTAPMEINETLAHDNDVMLFFCGMDKANQDDLCASIELSMENDVLPIEHTCAVYVPKGVALGQLKVKSMERPVLMGFCEYSSSYTGKPAKATEAAGKYQGYVVERYEPSSGIIPEAPEGFLQLLVWLAGDKVEGAPYLELCRFMCVNNTGPEPHTHAEDEFVAFIGEDPEHPEELYAEVHFLLGGEDISTTKSTVVYVPGNVKHSPILVPALDEGHDIIHFSGSNATEYVRNAAED